MNKEKFSLDFEVAMEDVIWGGSEFEEVENTEYSDDSWYVTRRHIVKRKDGKYFEFFLYHSKNDSEGLRDSNSGAIEFTEVFPKQVITTIYE